MPKVKRPRKPRPLKFRYRTLHRDNEQAYDCEFAEPRATVRSTHFMKAWEARRLGKWLVRWAEYADSKAKRGRKSV